MRVESDLAQLGTTLQVGRAHCEKKIIEQLGKDGKSWMPLAFENHAKYFGGIKGHEALEHNNVTEKLQNLGTRDDTDTRQALAPKRGQPDQFCVYKNAGCR